jgi:hypothetical protein
MQIEQKRTMQRFFQAAKKFVYVLLVVGLAGCWGGDDTSSSASGDACISCHGDIEWIHYYIEINECTTCHGGDGDSFEKETAHVAIPDNYWDVRNSSDTTSAEGFIKNFAPDQLDAIGTDYVRFINPSDYRVADLTCGLAGCHPDKTATAKNSIMSTNAGHYMPTLYLGGFTGQEAIYGASAAEDPYYNGAEGTVSDLGPHLPPEWEWETDKELEEIAYMHYLSKGKCNTCHGMAFGTNDKIGSKRSSGCGACHVPYNDNGVYVGSDSATPNNDAFGVRMAKHEITSQISVEQCSTCHFQGGRIGLLYRGIREGGFSTPPDPSLCNEKDLDCDGMPENPELWNEPVYGHDPGYYILDEDTTNDIDETPADVHYTLGLVCADCHVGSDVHGDGAIYSTSKGQVDLRCEDCHGTVRDAARPTGDDFLTERGRPLPQLKLEVDEVVLYGRMDGVRHVVPQPAEMLAEGGGASNEMHAAMGVDGEDWTHVDDVNCIACHTSYNQYCIGCHVTLDLRQDQADFQTGVPSPGLVVSTRDTWSLEHLLLGQGVDGRAWPVVPSQTVQMSVIDESGKTLLDDIFRVTPGSDANNGFVPFHQHTTSKKGKSCDACHRADKSVEELARVRGVYGHGTGEYMLSEPSGKTIDSLQFIDDDGNNTTEWVHPGTGPLSADVRSRALSVILDTEKALKDEAEAE